MKTKLSQEEFLQQFGIAVSHLTYHNFGSSISEYVEISSPYMILYETIDTGTGNTICIGLTEDNKNIFRSKLSDWKAIGDRPAHSHDFYELTIVLSGTFTLQIEKESVTYKAGECCLCNKNIHHKESTDMDREVVLFMFQEEYLQSLLANDVLYDKNGGGYIHKSFFTRLFKHNDNISFYSSKEYIDFRLKDTYPVNDFYRLLNSMILEIGSNRSGKNYFMKGYFCRFFSLISNPAHYEITFHQAKLSKEETLLYRVSLLLEERKGMITKEEIEKALNYNGDYINRIVKQHTGNTLSEYARLFLLKEAAELLRDTNKNIYDICEQLGYNNRSYFNKIFSRRYHCSPAEYRKQYQDSETADRKTDAQITDSLS